MWVVNRPFSNCGRDQKIVFWDRVDVRKRKKSRTLRYDSFLKCSRKSGTDQMDSPGIRLSEILTGGIFCPSSFSNSINLDITSLPMSIF